MSMVKGAVHYRGNGFLLIEQGDIGHKVIVPGTAVHDFSGDVCIYLHEVIRDNERELFGFRDIQGLELFWKLIAISGLGPKSAQKIVFAAPVDDVKREIMSGNLTFLNSVPGIGKKTAQKIVLELKGALAEEPDAPAVDTDALDALIGLGYTKRQAEEALLAVEGTGTDDRIRAALKALAL